MSPTAFDMLGLLVALHGASLRIEPAPQVGRAALHLKLLTPDGRVVLETWADGLETLLARTIQDILEDGLLGLLKSPAS